MFELVIFLGINCNSKLLREQYKKFLMKYEIKKTVTTGTQSNTNFKIKRNLL